MAKRTNLPRNVRPAVELSTAFVELLATRMGQIPDIQAGLSGVYEGRRLRGTYRLRLHGAELVPVEDSGAEPR